MKATPALKEDLAVPLAVPTTAPNAGVPPPASGRPATLEAVRSAWAEALAPLPCDFGLTWEQSGGDSQAIVYLLSGIEERLGRRVSLEVFSPEMTVVLLANSIDRWEPTPAGLALFVVPGIYGDDPKLAAFRRGWTGDLRLELVDLPDLGESAAVLGSVPATAALVAAEIVRRQPTGDIFLAGYSFGGAIAFEAAHKLVRAGRLVAFLSIIDARLDVHEPVAYSAAVRGFRPGLLLRFAARSIAATAPGRLALSHGVRRVAPRLHALLRTRALRHLRNRALSNWCPVPMPCNGPMATFVALSNEFAPLNCGRWQALCGGADVVAFACTHLGLFENVAFAEKLDDAARTARWSNGR